MRKNKWKESFKKATSHRKSGDCLKTPYWKPSKSMCWDQRDAWKCGPCKETREIHKLWQGRCEQECRRARRERRRNSQVTPKLIKMFFKIHPWQRTKLRTNGLVRRLTQRWSSQRMGSLLNSLRVDHPFTYPFLCLFSCVLYHLPTSSPIRSSINSVQKTTECLAHTHCTWYSIQRG